MKEYGKRVQIDPAEFWAMVDAGKSRKEIAKHFDVSVGTVQNRITKGRPSAACKTQATHSPSVAFGDSSLPEGASEGSSNTVGAIHESPDTHEEDKKENNDMDTNERIMNTFLGSGRPEAENSNNENDTYDNGTHAYDNGIGACDNEGFVPVDAASTYAAMFAEAAASIVKSAEAAGISIERTNITIKTGYTVAEISGADKDGKHCDLCLTVMDERPTFSCSMV